jgi:glycosyltransferase involved in cell wall biosynthesis
MSNRTQMPKIILILMVKNEEKILRRCLEALEGVVDGYAINDTGSTDKTVEIAQEFLATRTGCIGNTTWKDFGHNRSMSFQIARDFCVANKMDLADTYGLLLDADMVFVPGTLREQPLGEIGYTIVQSAGSLEYPNARLIRMDYDWVCKGVTHEYWDGPCGSLPKSTCYIDDHNDGGCKADKFTRDLGLLEKGLEEEPTNVRYMFYLAQTHHSMGSWEKAIEAYKRRITAGGWFEEVWYSHYMIAKTYEILNDPIQFEFWVLKAYEFYPKRAEAIYCLARYFRIKGDQYKAMHYIRLGKSIPPTTDSLFIEKDVYTGLFDYEETICRFYTLYTKQQALGDMTRYLLSTKPHPDNVYSNLPFYMDPLTLPTRVHPVDRYVFGEDYHPTSVSFFMHEGKLVHNVRFVNYTINPQTGGYLMKENGVVKENQTVRTQNAVFHPDTGELVKMRDESVSLNRKPGAHIVGLEDVRVYHNGDGALCCTATSWEYSDKIRIFQSLYDPVQGIYSQCRVLDSPLNQECEKNWIPVERTNDVIYSWNPLRVGTLDGTQLKFHTEHKTPWMFSHFRGSAVAFRPPQYPGETWALVHMVEYCTPRKYFHLFVRLGPDYKPKSISLPFVFRAKTIEYCIGCVPDPSCTVLSCAFSTMDDNPRLLDIPVASLEWIHV